MTLFIPPAYLANTFVTSREERDSDQGEDERESTGDVPLPEHDTEVLGGPGEYHLGWSVKEASTGTLVAYIHRALIPPHVHITVAHMAVIHVVHVDRFHTIGCRFCVEISASDAFSRISS